MTAFCIHRKQTATINGAAGRILARRNRGGAFAFIRREVDARHTPVQWIAAMTPLIFAMSLVLGVIIYIEAALLDWLH